MVNKIHVMRGVPAYRKVKPHEPKSTLAKATGKALNVIFGPGAIILDKIKHNKFGGFKKWTDKQRAPTYKKISYSRASALAKHNHYSNGETKYGYDPRYRDSLRAYLHHPEVRNSIQKASGHFYFIDERRSSMIMVANGNFDRLENIKSIKFSSSGGKPLKDPKDLELAARGFLAAYHAIKADIKTAGKRHFVIDLGQDQVRCYAEDEFLKNIGKGTGTKVAVAGGIWKTIHNLHKNGKHDTFIKGEKVYPGGAPNINPPPGPSYNKKEVNLPDDDSSDDGDSQVDLTQPQNNNPSNHEGMVQIDDQTDYYSEIASSNSKSSTEELLENINDTLDTINHKTSTNNTAISAEDFDQINEDADEINAIITKVTAQLDKFLQDSKSDNI